MKFSERIFRVGLSWSKLALVFVCVATVASATTAIAEEEEADEQFLRPDYVDTVPDIPNDSKECVFRGETHLHMDSWKVGECLKCVCNNGISTCGIESCPTLKCDLSDQVKIEGECCTKCSLGDGEIEEVNHPCTTQKTPTTFNEDSEIEEDNHTYTTQKTPTTVTVLQLEEEVKADDQETT